MKKLKCYPIMIARTFPATHPRKGRNTFFLEKIKQTYWPIADGVPKHKIHTIRKNYPLWEKRIKEVQDGKAYLSLRQWEGRPYHSEQVEFMKLTAADGVGIEQVIIDEVEICNDSFFGVAMPGNKALDPDQVAKNDGLIFKDFKAWFTPIPTEPLAIIHFTNFKYCK